MMDEADMIIKMKTHRNGVTEHLDGSGFSSRAAGSDRCVSQHVYAGHIPAKNMSGSYFTPK